jgi:hypothetical protein
MNIRSKDSGKLIRLVKIHDDGDLKPNAYKNTNKDDEN